MALPSRQLLGSCERPCCSHDCDAKETIMRKRLSAAMFVLSATAAAAVIVAGIDRTSAQGPAQKTALTTALMTPWGEPDLQGIWTDETDTPLQRPAKYATQEFFTPEQRAEIDRARADLLARERDRTERG